MALAPSSSCSRLCALAAVLAAAPAGALPDTQAVFDRFANSVAQIRIIETSSGAKAVIGSGFAAGDAKHVVTNYHVVSQLVYHADRYRGEAVRRDGSVVPIALQAIDVVHDVAVLVAEQAVGPPLHRTAVRPAQGTRLYALGYPLDLGLTIVQARTAAARPRSTKVTTGAEPRQAAARRHRHAATGQRQRLHRRLARSLPRARRPFELLAQVTTGLHGAERWLAVTRDGGHAYQDAYVARLLAEPVPTEAFASVRLGRDGAVREIRGDSFPRQGTIRDDRALARPTTTVPLRRSPAGVIEYQHEILYQRRPQPLQFFPLSRPLRGRRMYLPGSEDEVTLRATKLVESIRHPSSGLLRAYRKLPGSTTAREGRGAGARRGASQPDLVGVSFANARAVAQHPGAIRGRTGELRAVAPDADRQPRHRGRATGHPRGARPRGRRCSGCASHAAADDRARPRQRRAARRSVRVPQHARRAIRTDGSWSRIWQRPASTRARRRAVARIALATIDTLRVDPRKCACATARGAGAGVRPRQSRAGSRPPLVRSRSAWRPGAGLHQRLPRQLLRTPCAGAQQNTLVLPSRSSGAPLGVRQSRPRPSVEPAQPPGGGLRVLASASRPRRLAAYVRFWRRRPG